METVALEWILLQGSVFVCLVFLVLSFVIPFALALVTFLRQKAPPSPISSILVGRVWHTRHLPKRHAFNYPLFLFGLELTQEVEQDGLFEDRLWPLSCIMSFRESDHLINGEGLTTQESGPSKDANGKNQTAGNNNSLSRRVCRLVSERTQGGFEPTNETHFIYLITHLSYYGYCFNPVSFYYIVDKTTQSTEAIVAEVSNTPWNEMFPYVLHKQSSDQVKVVPRTDSTNFMFPKRFHVSPFMEMEYVYDWIFDDWRRDRARVVTAMKTRPNKEEATGGGKLQFTATMNVRALGLHPLVLAWQLARYPVYCMLIQIWIHYEAFWLFLKGIAFQPHHTGAETTASRVIGDLMTPLFAVQDLLSGKNKKNNKGHNMEEQQPVHSSSIKSKAE